MTSSHSAQVTSDRRLDQRAAGIVDQYIDGAERAHRRAKCLRDIDFDAQIEPHRHEFASLHRRIAFQCVEHIHVKIGNREIVTGARQGAGDGVTETGRGAGDKRSGTSR